MEKDNKKSVHCNSSGSAWTISTLKDYIQRENIAIAFKLPEPTVALALQSPRPGVTLSIRAICGNDYVEERLENPLYSFNNLGNTTESDTRMILDAILQPLCLRKGLKIRTEETLKCQSPRLLGNGRNLLPTNKYDYILYDNNNDSWGDLNAIVQKLSWIIDQAIQSRVLKREEESSEGRQFIILKSNKAD